MGCSWQGGIASPLRGGPTRAQRDGVGVVDVERHSDGPRCITARVSAAR